MNFWAFWDAHFIGMSIECRKSRLLPLLLLVGCGGAPFEFAAAHDGGAPEGEPTEGATSIVESGIDSAPTDAKVDAVEDAAAPGSDASRESGTFVEAGREGGNAKDVVEEPRDADGGQDASSSEEDAGQCTPIEQSTYVCGGTTVSSPSQFCVYNLGTGVGAYQAMPAACQCAETFTCACLLDVESPCGGGTQHTCAVDGAQLTVTCS